MATTETILNECEERLHDPSNKIWARAELLDYLNEGYEDVATRSAMLATFTGFDSPGRWGYAACFPWEVEQVRPARAWLPFFRYGDARYRVAYKFELEHLDARTPTNSGNALTQPWEVAYQVTDRPLPFPLPEEHVRTIRPSWDFRRLGGATVRELDDLDYDWWENTATLPRWLWADTLGTKKFGIFPLHAGYNQAFALSGSAPNGTPREYSGDRTYSVSSFEPAFRAVNGYTSDADGYNAKAPAWRFTRKASDSATSYVTQTWEEDHVESASTLRTGQNVGVYFWEHHDHDVADNFPAAFAVGVPRAFSGRDYVIHHENNGAPRGWQSSDASVGLIYARIPKRLEVESEVPDEIHPRFHKYLRFYVLMKAFNRQGPGRNPKLSAYYRARYEMGLALFKRIANAIGRDIQFQRERVPTPSRRRPPRVQLPPEFEQVLQ